jgi:hypothetical protein
MEPSKSNSSQQPSFPNRIAEMESNINAIEEVMHQIGLKVFSIRGTNDIREFPSKQLKDTDPKMPILAELNKNIERLARISDFLYDIREELNTTF